MKLQTSKQIQSKHEKEPQQQKRINKQQKQKL